MRKTFAAAYLLIAGSISAIQAQPPASLFVQRGHNECVTSVAVSRDGRFVVTGCQDGVARLWELATGREIRRFVGHKDSVNKVALSADGKRLATASGRFPILIIDQENDKVTKLILDRSAALWDIATGKLLKTFDGHENNIVSLGLSDDGSRLVTGSEDETVALWDAETGKKLRSVPGQIAAISRDGAWFVAADDKTNAARLHEAATGKIVRTFSQPVVGFNEIIFSADGKRIAACGYKAMIAVWETGSGKLLRSIAHPGIGNCIAMSEDGKRVASGRDGYENHDARIWDIDSGAIVRTFVGHQEAIAGVAFSPDGKHLVTAGDWDETARLWDVDTGKEIRRFDGRADEVNSLSLSADGKRLAAGSGDEYGEGDRNAFVWDLAAGKRLQVFKGHTRAVRGVCLSADGKNLLTGSCDETVRWWDVDTGKQIREIKAHTAEVWGVALSRGGKFTYSATGGCGVETGPIEELEFSIRKCDVESGKKLQAFSHHGTEGIRSFVITSDEKWLIAGTSNPEICIWNLATGKQERELKGHKAHIASVALSTDGRLLASGSWDGTVRIWDFAKGTELRVIEGQKGTVDAVTFSRNGKLLASGGLDGIVRLWNVDTGKLVRELRGHDKCVTTMLFAGDDRWLYTAGADATTRLWETKTGKEICRLIACRDGSWVVCDSEGRFDDGGDAEGVHLVSGMRSAALRDSPDWVRDSGLLAKHLGFDLRPLREVRPRR